MADLIQISASLLAADFGRLRAEMQKAEASGVDRYHFDLMDGHYVPNLALAPDHIRALRPHSKLPFDVHLELANPQEAIEYVPWEGVSTVIFQADTLSTNTELFEKARSRGLRVALCANPDTHLAPLKPLMPEIDQFLVLGVQPGFGGQPMHPATAERLREVRSLAGNAPIEIAVDGGVNFENAPEMVAAGADILVIGTAIFAAEDLGAAIRHFHRTAASCRDRTLI